MCKYVFLLKSARINVQLTIKAETIVILWIIYTHENIFMLLK